MICKQKWKHLVLAVGAAVSLMAMAAPSALAQGPKYPDLRSLVPSNVHLGTALVGSENHYVVRFTNVIANAGDGPFELHGAPHFPLDGQFDASQWIYHDPAGLSIEPVGSFAFHANHQHFHFDGFARYELWTKREFERAQSRNFASGAPMAVSPKVSFCILDIRRTDPSKGPPRQVYRTCTPAMEGLSPGWGDVYDWTLPDQWVDVGRTPLPDGDYVIRTIADPDNIVFESNGKADPDRESHVANSAVRYISIVNGQLAS